MLAKERQIPFRCHFLPAAAASAATSDDDEEEQKPAIANSAIILITIFVRTRAHTPCADNDARDIVRPLYGAMAMVASSVISVLARSA